MTLFFKSIGNVKINKDDRIIDNGDKIKIKFSADDRKLTFAFIKKSTLTSLYKNKFIEEENSKDEKTLYKFTEDFLKIDSNYDQFGKQIIHPIIYSIFILDDSFVIKNNTVVLETSHTVTYQDDHLRHRINISEIDKISLSVAGLKRVLTFEKIKEAKEILLEDLSSTIKKLDFQLNQVGKTYQELWKKI